MPTGRAAHDNPAQRFLRQQVQSDYEQVDEADYLQLAEPRAVPTEFLPDQSQSLIVGNNSPDIVFDYSINPYRGCEHGCAYCYARPSHEYLGFGAGLDFETKILVKHDAPEILRRELASPKWRGDLIAFSGNTDCYQPVERTLQLTRRCLQVMVEARQCTAIITKNALVTRDLDLLAELAQHNLAQVNVSLTCLDPEILRRLEPRTSSPAARLRAISQLTAAGIPVRVMLAPIIPGLTDEWIPRVLEAGRQAGAQTASYLLLRLPTTVEPVFHDWLARAFPDKLERVEGLIRQTRGGRMSDSEFGRRMVGQGAYAAQIQQTFQVFAKAHGLDRKLAPLDTSQFVPPRPASGQLRLF
jgi:DNA repair photolyase